jgi:hypothetical protein
MENKEFEINITNYVNSDSVFWRTAWNKIKRIFNQYYEMWIKVNLNFEGIKSVTHSFIDELIWAYIYYDSEKALEKIKFTNCNSDVKTMIKFVVSDRMRNSQEKI